MKRAWLVIFGVVITLVIVVMWWLLRDTPEKVLRDGIFRIASAKSIGALRLDVSWTDPEKRITVGWTALGQADTSDLTQPGFFGVLFLGAGVNGDEQSEDVVLKGTTIAVRPVTVSKDMWEQFDVIVKDPTHKSFISVDRDILLDRSAIGWLRAQGKTASIQSVLPSFASVVRVAGPAVITPSGGRSYVTVPFALDRVALEPFLVALARSWKASALSAAEIQRIQHVAEELSRGTYRMTIDRSSREPAMIDATWPELDAALGVTRRITVHAETFARNAPVDIALPTARIDGTAVVFKIPLERLPSSIERLGSAAPTGTAPVPATRSASDEERFAEYMDELQRRKKRY